MNSRVKKLERSGSGLIVLIANDVTDDGPDYRFAWTGHYTVTRRHGESSHAFYKTQPLGRSVVVLEGDCEQL